MLDLPESAQAEVLSYTWLRYLSIWIYVKKIMRRVRWTRVARLVGAWACVLAANPSAASPIRLATHDQAPYGTFQKDQTFDGIAVRVISCVLKRMNRQFVVEVYPWIRAQYMAEHFEVDGFFPATLKKERLEWSESTEIIAEQKWVWYLPVDSTLDPLSSEFKSVAKVGAHFGSNRLAMLEDQKYIVVAHPATDEQLLLMLTLGRMDAMLAGNLSVAEAMREHKIDPKRFRRVLERDAPLYAYFGKKFLKSEPNFINQFNKQIPACRP
jgi:polar amino acid transport system substrate-binding protein